MAVNQISKRAKTNFPAVLLTLLSIVQALALELLWEHVSNRPMLLQLSDASVLGWLQITATLLGILLIWVIYSSLVMRFSWVPTTTDSIFPFLIGIVEFAQINRLASDNIGGWFVVSGALFGVVAWISQVSMKRARQDSDNADFFTSVEPATLRDHVSSAIPAIVLVLTGIGLWLADGRGPWAPIATSLLLVLLGWQLWLNHVYTERSYHREESQG